MGFFSRTKRAATSAPPPSKTTTLGNNQRPQSDPPSYWEDNVNYGSLPEVEYAQQPHPYINRNEFMSVEDFNTIQQIVDEDLVSDQFSSIISQIDEDRWNEHDDDFSIVITEGPRVMADHLQETSRAVVSSRNSRERRPTQAQKITIWSKVSFYENSRLVDNLPPLRVYIPTWPLICLAAQYSASAYKAPASTKEREAFVSADSRLGTKAMVMKSVPCDDKKTLVFAIRGTSTLSLRDWNVNLRTIPVSPVGFLDDEGNYCHEGFLKVAKAMIRPIALRLRTLLEENPSRASCSLLITGHSAGGAVAALLFTHMLSSQESELSILTGCFKRVHCVTFGAPPVSLLPLTKPPNKKFAKSLFFSFMNEGDPVVRADKEYVRSLVNLLSSPLPIVNTRLQRPQKVVPAKSSFMRLQQSISRLDLNLSNTPSRPNGHVQGRTGKTQKPQSVSRYWSIPVSTLSNAGRLVVMRVPPQPVNRQRKGPNSQMYASSHWERQNLSKVTVHTVNDEQLRQVIFGDPTMHAMEVYLRRVDMLALKAVTARG